MTESAHNNDLVARFRAARSDSTLVVIEGFHPLKHAIRFGAELVEVVTSDDEALISLALDLAPDIAEALNRYVRTVPPEAFDRLVPEPPHTGVVAIARRPRVSPLGVLSQTGPEPVVVLDHPVHLGNVGAAIRVAAAAQVAGVLVTGDHDPWHPDALRGAAGLQFAVPVTRLGPANQSPRGTEDPSWLSYAGMGEQPHGDRPLVALDPEGERLRPEAIPPRALLVFGSERRGLPADVLEHADRRLRIPMRPGVSSLNLATSVAVVLYAWRLAR